MIFELYIIIWIANLAPIAPLWFFRKGSIPGMWYAVSLLLANVVLFFLPDLYFDWILFTFPSFVTALISIGNRYIYLSEKR
jgi:hypothetical protein